MSSTKTVVLKNLIWRFAERILAQLITTVVSIILARLLSPDDYGVIAIIMIMINFCNILVSKGFNSSLIQKSDADDLDFSTAFFINLGITVVIYIALFFSAPYIAAYYGTPLLTPLIRVMGIRIPFTALNSIQNAFVARRLQFKKYFFSTISGTLVSAVVGIVMAYNGFGAWALVGQYLTTTITNSMVLWFTVRWRPKLIFSLKRAGFLFSYGWKILVAALMEELTIEFKSFVIGKKYSTGDLGYYNRGHQFPQIINTNVNEAIVGVMFPVFSKEQTDINVLKEHMRKSLKNATYIMFPLLLGLLAVSREVTVFLLTEKWLESVPFMQIFCITYMFTTINSLNIQVTKALGKSGQHLKMTILNLIFSIAVTAISVPFGVIWVAAGGILSAVFATFMNTLPVRKYIGYGFLSQLKDLIPIILMSVSMVAVTMLVNLLNLPVVAALILKIVLGAAYYISVSYLTKYECFYYILDLIFKRRKKMQ